jgi:hypothetical protein
MTTQNYLMVQNNVVTNVCVWDGDTNTWQPPTDATMLVESTTIAMIWAYPEGASDYVLVPLEGQGAIGFTWDGTVLTTNEPKPETPPQPIPQPISQPT